MLRPAPAPRSPARGLPCSVISTSGTSWVQLPLLPGEGRPARTPATSKATVRFSPSVPGARPWNSSLDKVCVTRCSVSTEICADLPAPGVVAPPAVRIACQNHQPAHPISFRRSGQPVLASVAGFRNLAARVLFREAVTSNWGKTMICRAMATLGCLDPAHRQCRAATRRRRSERARAFTASACPRTAAGSPIWRPIRVRAATFHCRSRAGQSTYTTSVDGRTQRLGGCGWVSAEPLVGTVFALRRVQTEVAGASRFVALDADGSDIVILGSATLEADHWLRRCAASWNGGARANPNRS